MGATVLEMNPIIEKGIDIVVLWVQDLKTWLMGKEVYLVTLKVIFIILDGHIVKILNPILIVDSQHQLTLEVVIILENP